MADRSELSEGQRVTTTHRGREKEAIVRKVPPFTEDICGDEVERTDSVRVQYPNTSLDGGDFFGDIQETVALENIEVDQ